jgi:hypothetical protein
LGHDYLPDAEFFGSMARATVPISARLNLNTRTIVGPLDDGIDRHLGMGRAKALGVLDDVL